MYGIAANAGEELIIALSIGAHTFEPADPVKRTTTVFVVGDKVRGLSQTVMPLLSATFKLDVPHKQYYERLHNDAILSIVLHHYISNNSAPLQDFHPRRVEGEKFALDQPLANWRAKHTEKEKRCTPLLLDEGEGDDVDIVLASMFLA